MAGAPLPLDSISTSLITSGWARRTTAPCTPGLLVQPLHPVRGQVRGWWTEGTDPNTVLVRTATPTALFSHNSGHSPGHPKPFQGSHPTCHLRGPPTFSQGSSRPRAQAKAPRRTSAWRGQSRGDGGAGRGRAQSSPAPSQPRSDPGQLVWEQTRFRPRGRVEIQICPVSTPAGEVK